MRYYQLLILVATILLSGVSSPEEVLTDRRFKLEAQVERSKLLISLENVSNVKLAAYNGFVSPYTPGGWPQFCYLQLRTREGRVLIYDDQGSDLWTPWTLVSQAIITPVEMSDLLHSQASDLEDEPRLGPLSLGMSREQVRQIVGAEEFPGLRNTSPKLTGGFFLSASGDAMLNVVFDRQRDELTYASLTSELLHVVAVKEDAESVGFADWKSPLYLEGWNVSNFGLEASKGQLLQALGGLEQDGLEDIDSIYIQYREKADKNYVCSSSGTSLVFFRETVREPQWMKFDLFDGKIESITLAIER